MAKQIVAFLLISYSVFAGVYGGGSGTADDPYQIWTVEHLDELGTALDDYDKAFILMADIDLAGIVYSQAPIAPDQDPNTWGFQGTSFSGVFDGNSHAIRNLTIQNKETDYIGLFGRLESSSEIKNLTLANVSLTGRCIIGAVAAENLGTISNCHVSGAITGGYAVGGITAFLDGGKILYSSTHITIFPVPFHRNKTCQFIGGLVGWAHLGLISDSSSTMILASDETVRSGGGLVGINLATTLEHCWAKPTIYCIQSTAVGGVCGNNWGSIRNCLAVDVDIKTQGESVGGLVGINSSLISQCIAEGKVRGQTQCGGLIGDNKGYVIDSYTSVTINSETFSGGFAASNHYGILRCYSLGAAQCRSFEPGGFVGQNLGYINHSFWDIETSGVFQSDGAEGMNSQQLKQLATYQCWGDGVWVIEENIGYPKLIWENTPGVVIRDEPAVYSGGSGTEEDPFLIDLPAQLSGIGEYPQDLSKCYKLMNDLDMSGVDFSGIGFGHGFEGTFDGNGYAIHNLSLNGTMDYTGLFCVVLARGTVKNLNILDYQISGKNYVGALAGKSEGTIENCYTRGNVIITGDTEKQASKPQYYGGLTGLNYGTITHCQADVELTVRQSHANSFGGLAGFNACTIRQSCAVGSMTVSADDTFRFGGLIGICGWDSKVMDAYCRMDITVSGKRCHDVGGFTGYQSYRSRIERSYSTGTMILNSTDPNGYGGFIGLNGHIEDGNAKVIGCFWNVEQSGIDHGIGTNYDPNENPVGLSSEQMLDINTYAQAGWSVDSVPNDDAVWIVLPDSLPELSCFIVQEPRN